MKCVTLRFLHVSKHKRKIYFSLDFKNAVTEFEQAFELTARNDEGGAGAEALHDGSRQELDDES